MTKGNLSRPYKYPARFRNDAVSASFPFFWALLVGQPAVECVVIHTDLGRRLSFTVAMLLQISLERAHQLIWANYISLLQSRPPLLTGRPAR